MLHHAVVYIQAWAGYTLFQVANDPALVSIHHIVQSSQLAKYVAGTDLCTAHATY